MRCKHIGQRSDEGGKGSVRIGKELLVEIGAFEI